MAEGKEQEAMKGGPEGEGHQAQQGQEHQNTQDHGGGERVKVQVGDREIEVDGSVAAILEAQQRGFEEYQRQMAQYVRQLEQRLTQRPGEGGGEKEQAPDFYSDPEGFMQYHLGRAKREIQEYVGQQLMQSQKKVREREFWDSFYDEYDDLKDAQGLVQYVFQSNLDRLADLPVSKAKQEIARLARAEREKLIRPYLQGGVRSGGEGEQSLRQIVARPGQASGQGRGVTRGSEDEPQTLGAILKARRQRRFQRRGVQE